MSPEFIADIDWLIELIKQAENGGLFRLNGQVQLIDSNDWDYLDSLVYEFIESNGLDDFRAYLDRDAIAKDLETRSIMYRILALVAGISYKKG